MSRSSPLPGILAHAKGRLERLEKRQAEGLFVSPEALVNTKALVRHLEARIQATQGLGVGS